MMGAAKPHGTASRTRKAPAALSPGEAADRRKHALVYNYWLSLKGARPYPSIWDLDPFEIADAGPNSVMLDLSKDRDKPEIFVGEALRSDGNAGGERPDARSLHTCILRNYRSVLKKTGPIAFEDKCTLDGSRTIYCFGTLLPFTSAGGTIDYIFGMMSWRDVTEVAAAADAPPAKAKSRAAAVSADPVADETPPKAVHAAEAAAAAEPGEAAMGQPQDDGPVFGESAADEVAFGDIMPGGASPDPTVDEEPGRAITDGAASADPLPANALPDDAGLGEPNPEEPVFGEAESDEIAFADAVSRDALPDLARPEDVPYEEIPISPAAQDDPLPVEVVTGPDLGPADARPIEAPDDRLLDEAAPDAVPGLASTDEALSPEVALSFDPVLGEPVPDEVVSDARIFDAPLLDDAASRISAIGKAFFGAVRHFVVSDQAVSYESTRAAPRILSVGDLFAEAASRDPAHIAVASEDHSKEGAAAMPAEAELDAPLPGEADAGDDSVGEEMAGHAQPAKAAFEAPHPIEAGPDDDAPGEGAGDAMPAKVPVDAEFPGEAHAGEELMAGDAEPGEALPEDELLDGPLSPDTAEAGPDGGNLLDEQLADEAPSVEAAAPAVFVELAPLDVASGDEPKVSGAAFDPASGDGAGPDGNIPEAAPPAVFVELAPLDAVFAPEEPEHATAVLDHSTTEEATPDAAARADPVVVDFISLDRILADAELEEAMSEDAVPAPQPQPEVAESHEEENAPVADVPPVAHEPAAEPPARPAAPKPDQGLHGQLSIAQAIASSAQDASYQGRAILYVALGHAYDFALAAEADQGAYVSILQEAGLDHQARSPMTTVVELVFGQAYDGEQLNDFVTALAWARRAQVPSGGLASHLEFLDAGLAVVAPVKSA